MQGLRFEHTGNRAAAMPGASMQCTALAHLAGSKHCQTCLQHAMKLGEAGDWTNVLLKQHPTCRQGRDGAQKEAVPSAAAQ